MFLTKRDSFLLTYLHIVKVASRKQINRDVYKGYLEQNTRRRLKILKDNSYILANRPKADGDRSNLYSLTNKGFKMVQEYLPLTLVNKRFKSDSIEHDLALVEIKYVLSQKKHISRYYAENQIQSYSFFDEDDELIKYKNLFFDAFMLGKNESGKEFNIGIQYEQTQKNESRYREILTDYYLDKSLQYIFYICTGKAIENILKKNEKQISNSSDKKLYFIQYKDLVDPNKTTKFINQDNKVIEIH